MNIKQFQICIKKSIKRDLLCAKSSTNKPFIVLIKVWVLCCVGAFCCELFRLKQDVGSDGRTVVFKWLCGVFQYADRYKYTCSTKLPHPPKKIQKRWKCTFSWKNLKRVRIKIKKQSIYRWEWKVVCVYKVIYL